MFWSLWTGCLQVTVMTSLLHTVYSIDDFHCSREHSRVVRNTLREHFFPEYEKRGVDLHKTCLLHESHDIYIYQEMSKVEEHSSRWTCDLCGKIFYGEHFLDLHLHNKHHDKLVKDSPVCLADYCDLFRCDFLLDFRRETFWEKALCSEDKMFNLRRRCEVLMHSCLPEGNLRNETEYNIYEETKIKICSLLTCKDYWKLPYEEVPPWKVILYAVISPFFIMGLIAYYYCAWEYYFGDLFQDSGSEMEQHSDRYVKSWQREGELRNRYRPGRVHMY